MKVPTTPTARHPVTIDEMIYTETKKGVAMEDSQFEQQLKDIHAKCFHWALSLCHYDEGLAEMFYKMLI